MSYVVTYIRLPNATVDSSNQAQHRRAPEGIYLHKKTGKAAGDTNAQLFCTNTDMFQTL